MIRISLPKLRELKQAEYERGKREGAGEERERCLDIMYSIEKSDLTLAIGAAICEANDDN